MRSATGIDPLFASLLRHHWMEEAQHAKIDTLMVEALADGRSDIAMGRAVGEYLEIAGFLDAGLRDAGRRGLGAGDRAGFVAQQHQAARWTYLAGRPRPDRRSRADLLLKGPDP